MKKSISLDNLKGAIIEYVDNGEKGLQPLICVSKPDIKERYYITITNSHKFYISKE